MNDILGLAAPLLCIQKTASLPHTLLRMFPNLLRRSYGVQAPLWTLGTKDPPEEGSPPSLPISPYSHNEPWKYLDSEYQKATVFALFGLTTSATTKVVYHHRGPGRHAFLTIKLSHLPGSQVAC